MGPPPWPMRRSKNWAQPCRGLVGPFEIHPLLLPPKLLSNHPDHIAIWERRYHAYRAFQREAEEAVRAHQAARQREHERRHAPHPLVPGGRLGYIRIPKRRHERTQVVSANRLRCCPVAHLPHEWNRVPEGLARGG